MCDRSHLGKKDPLAGELLRDGIAYAWLVFGGVLIVTAPDGRQKKTQLGNSPPDALARIMARELEQEKPDN